MGIYDRDYYRNPPGGGFGSFRLWSITTWLIIINIAVFCLDNWMRPAITQSDMLADPFRLDRVHGPLAQWGWFSLQTAVHHLQLWRFVTFQFLHSGPYHVLLNMLGLYLFGPIVEGQLHGRRYLAFYLLCGLAGPVVYLLFSSMHILISDPASPMVGASAGVFGVLVAAAFIAPDMEVPFWYWFPMKLRTLAWVMMLIALVTVFSQGYNAGGEAAHLGGGLLGLALILNQHWLNPFASGRPAGRRPRRRRLPRKLSPGQKDWSKDLNR